MSYYSVDVPVGQWHRSSRSFAEGPAPHVPPGMAKAPIDVVWADPDRTAPAAANDYDGCWALVEQPWDPDPPDFRRVLDRLRQR